MSERIVVLGGGYAGVLAAIRTARGARGRAEVTLVNGSDQFVERIRLHQVASGQPPRARSVAAMVERAGVRFVRGIARAIDLARREVDVDGAPLGYDRLVVALGSRTDTVGVPGVEHAFTLDPGAAERMKLALPAVAARAGRVVVCGGGLTAIECATEVAESFPSLKVSLVTDGIAGPRLSARARAHLAGAFARLGVELVEATPVRAIRPHAIETAAGARPFELCVWAGGFRGPALIAAAGLAVNERGQALVDAQLRSVSHPEVWVVGDAAFPADPVGAPIVMGCKTAMPMGAHAANNLVRLLDGKPLRAFSFGDTGYCISLGRRDGIVQLVHPDGTLRDRVFTGRVAAFIKEQICRYTTRSLWLEAHGWLRYRWLPGPKHLQLAGGARKELAA